MIKNRKSINKFDNKSILTLTIFNFDGKSTIFNFCEIRTRDLDFRDDFDIHNITVISLTVYCRNLLKIGSFVRHNISLRHTGQKKGIIKYITFIAFATFIIISKKCCIIFRII